MRMIIWIMSIAITLTTTAVLFMNQSSFGRIPRGERLERIRQSPNYKDGEFKNLHETQLMTSGKGRFRSMWGFIFKKKEGLRPLQDIAVVKTELRKIASDKDALVWFGHSSYLYTIRWKANIS